MPSLVPNRFLVRIAHPCAYAKAMPADTEEAERLVDLPESARLHLIQLAIAGNERLRVLDVEFTMPKPSYTIDTLDELCRQYPDVQFALLMGGDNLPGLPRWKSADRLLAEFDVYVYPRPGYELPNPLPANVRVVDAPLLDISATFIRGSIQAGQSIRYLVPEAVEREVQANKYWL